MCKLNCIIKKACLIQAWLSDMARYSCKYMHNYLPHSTRVVHEQSPLVLFLYSVSFFDSQQMKENIVVKDNFVRDKETMCQERREMLRAAMAAWTLKSGQFLINYDVILDNNRGYNALCYDGNIFHCMKSHERKPRTHQWRLLHDTLIFSFILNCLFSFLYEEKYL